MAMAMISKPLTCGKNIPGLPANPSMASKKYREDLRCPSRSISVRMSAVSWTLLATARLTAPLFVEVLQPFSLRTACKSTYQIVCVIKLCT
ncbi:hypothetical protein DPMN_037812 [Dreissena polymorpha]|uniref:Uncharacterized protein n=1 Tax=Dreissena polymorpha TaxID=45954 RepID=A0A9D4ME33_DREPO|nr:hypothetical protein DPMN_037812 [Dreissena polymorpha]